MAQRGPYGLGQADARARAQREACDPTRGLVSTARRRAARLQGRRGQLPRQRAPALRGKLSQGRRRDRAGIYRCRTACRPRAGFVEDGQSVRARRAVRRTAHTMTDYWLSKLFFDLQHDEKLAADFRQDMASVIDRYEIAPAGRKALLADDVAVLAPLVNAYLLRFYFQIRGLPQEEFTARL